MNKYKMAAWTAGAAAAALLAACGGGAEGANGVPEPEPPASTVPVAPPAGSIWDKASRAYQDGLYMLQSDGRSYAYEQKFSVADRMFQDAPVRIEARNASARFALPSDIDSRAHGFTFLADGAIFAADPTRASADESGAASTGPSRLHGEGQQLQIDYLDRRGGKVLLSYRVESFDFTPVSGRIADAPPPVRGLGARFFSAASPEFDGNKAFAAGAGYYTMSLRPARDGLRIHACRPQAIECAVGTTIESAFPLDFAYYADEQPMRWQWSEGQVETVLGKRMWIARGNRAPHLDRWFGVFVENGRVQIGLLIRPTDAPTMVYFLNASAAQSLGGAIR